MQGLGLKMYNLAKALFPVCRSITGNGVRESLRIIQNEIPELKIHEVPTGEKCFDWTVPQEWNINDAYIADSEGKKVIDFKNSNLHVVGYSIPIRTKLSLLELEQHLYSLPDQPNAIPYITSYYKPRWGFCLTHEQRKRLKPGEYEVLIDSTLTDGSLSYAELILPGESSQEIFLSTYTCHPSLANDNLSGICVTTYLAKWLAGLKSRKYTYRIIFIPETIGSIVYTSRHLEAMKKNIIAGFNVTCVGDAGAYSYIASRDESTLADRIALHVLKHVEPNFRRYTFLDRGSDERQYCSPGIDLPFVSVMKSRHGGYPEYHTSLDNLECISADSLQGSYETIKKCIECIEGNEHLKLTVYGEPQLSKRDLYPTLSTSTVMQEVENLRHLIAYSDGKTSLLEIAEKINLPMWVLFPLVDKLKKEGLLRPHISTTFCMNAT